MNNFIIGQVTPDMLETMRYGTYIFFGLLTLGGAFFVWKFVPETKNLSLEEMDIVFGSAGVAARDQEIMDEVNREVGLAYLTGTAADARSSEEKPEKFEVIEKN
jgi:membrane-bound ClpP family serine protease